MGPTPAKPFKSRFTGGVETWITAPQYLAENMVARSARRKNVDLPEYFWRQERWAREFALQARHAAGLLSLYSVEAIIRALRTKDGQRVFSFGAKHLDPIIKAEQEKIDAQNALKPPESVASAPAHSPAEPPRPTFVEQTKLSKLKGL